MMVTLPETNIKFASENRPFKVPKGKTHHLRSINFQVANLLLPSIVLVGGGVVLGGIPLDSMR